MRRRAVLVHAGPALVLLDPDGSRLALPIARFPSAVRGRSFPDGLAVETEDLLRAARAEGIPAALADAAEVRSSRAGLSDGRPVLDRPWLLERARSDLARALDRPGETLTALAREEERLERSLGREVSAQSELAIGTADPLARYRSSASRLRADLDRHLAVVRQEVARGAGEVAPNLSRLLGGSLAARLIAAAGGLPRLASMDSSRLQLLGTRRRPSPVRGPRFGLLYRALEGSGVPPARWAAYARSLAALAVIAARADAFTHASVAPTLIARRDRRAARLRTRR